jgi:hypothetical protein
MALNLSRLKLRRDTSADWVTYDPVLAAGEPGYETDTGKLKIGDGVTAWTSLPYSFDVQGLIDGAPTALDTLNEIAAAISDNASFSSSVLTKTDNLASVADAATARTNLVAVPGTNIQAYDANLASFLSAVDLPSSDGSADQLLQTNGAGTLSFQPPPEVAGTFTATASGSIADGDPCVVNSDGTVSSAGNVSFSSGSWETEFDLGAQTPYYDAGHAAVDPVSGIICNVFRETSSQSNLLFLSDDGDGTFTVLSETSPADFTDPAGYATIISLGDDKFFYVHHKAGNYTAYVIDYNGGSPVVGPGTAISSSTAVNSISAHVASNGNVIVFYGLTTDALLYATAVSISGATITAGTTVSFSSTSLPTSGSPSSHQASFSVGGYEYCFYYHDAPGVDAVWYVVASVSGTTVTVENAGATTGISNCYGRVHAAWDPYRELAMVMYGYGFSTHAYMFACTVSGTVVTAGSSVNMASSKGLSSINFAPFLIASDFQGAFFASETAPYIRFRTWTTSGTTITLDADIGAIAGAENDYASACVGPDAFYGFVNDTNTDLSVLAFYGTSVLTSSNYIGISYGNYANSSTATVQITGAVDDAQTGLTPGATYYVNGSGISTSPGTPSVVAGQAVSATRLKVRYN